jgi:uncharacterized membrane protein YeaQ/YmgE (transglycosylase-associated protein family)
VRYRTDDAAGCDYLGTSHQAMPGAKHLNVIIWILAGALLGIAVSLALGTRNRARIALDVVTGIVGVLSGGWLLGALTGMSAFNPEAFFIASLLVSLLGATVLLTALQMFRSRSTGETPARQDNASKAPPIGAHATTPAMRELK